MSYSGLISLISPDKVISEATQNFTKKVSDLKESPATGSQFPLNCVLAVILIDMIMHNFLISLLWDVFQNYLH